MIKIDKDNFIKVEKQDDYIKLILNIKIGFKKLCNRIKLNQDQVKDLTTKLISENSKIK